MNQMVSGIFGAGLTLSIYFALHQYVSAIRWLTLSLSDRVLTIAAICVVVGFIGAGILYASRRWFKHSKDKIVLICLALFVVSLSPLRQVRGPDGDAPHYLAAARYFAMTGSFENVDAYHGREHVKFFLPYAEIWELPDRRVFENVDGVQQFFYSVLLPVIAAPFSMYKPEMSFFFGACAFDLSWPSFSMALARFCASTMAKRGFDGVQPCGVFYSSALSGLSGLFSCGRRIVGCLIKKTCDSRSYERFVNLGKAPLSGHRRFFNGSGCF